ncbi:cation-dependent mannose-6-phosphate receptor-like, partial [Limulus polyphemus]|uniref:Cation-dependent mannose-6-phosphate receptor-like n=1 Tax=Limulus polyphemus TaxID=6850 RepID=A0ABM1SDM2_LIMPO
FSGKPSATKDNANYYFNPCYNFSYNVANKCLPCTDVAACRITATKQEVIGLQNPKFWETATGAIAVNYSASSSSPPRSKNLLVFLECNKSATAPVLRVKGCDPCQGNASTNFTMTLHGKEVCLQILNEDNSSGISTGSVLLLIFLISVQVYLTIGILYNICIVGAKGKEVIPNIAFWQDVLSLIKDGCLFTFNCCRVNVNYDKL